MISMVIRSFERLVDSNALLNIGDQPLDSTKGKTGNVFFASLCMVCFVMGIATLSGNALAQGYYEAAHKYHGEAARGRQKNSKQDLKKQRKELKELSRLSIAKLRLKVSEGNALAAVALSRAYSVEHTDLANLPQLANSAAEDAIKWSSIAAQMGALQPRSSVGVSQIPIRAQRKRHR